ncbi:MAG: hypothetical protein M3Z04_20785 [Chloroflexota bacterium]|nr:hypothetical protein [Chloroflexota bacterium]
MTINELRTYSFAGSAPALAAPGRDWATARAAFARWAATYRDTIRKKARRARDAAARQDLRAELAVAPGGCRTGTAPWHTNCTPPPPPATRPDSQRPRWALLAGFEP